MLEINKVLTFVGGVLILISVFAFVSSAQAIVDTVAVQGETGTVDQNVVLIQGANIDMTLNQANDTIKFDVQARRSATKIVAAYNSLDTTKADYVCDGTADQVEIQAALDALPSGGKVILLEGSYSISSSIIVGGPSVWDITLEGVSLKTGLTLANSANCTLIDFGASTGRHIIRDMSLSGNKANNTSGTAIDLSDTVDMRFANLHIGDFKDYGIYGYNLTDKLPFWFNDIHIFNCNNDGMNLTYVSGIYAKGVHINGCGGDGLSLLRCVENYFTLCSFDVNSENGVYLDNPTQKITIVNCYIGGNGYWGILMAGDHLGEVIMGNTINQNGALSLYTGGIAMPESNGDTIVIGNWIKQTAGNGWGVYIRGSASYLTVVNNNLRNCTNAVVISGTGTGNGIKDNIGYVHESEIGTLQVWVTYNSQNPSLGTLPANSMCEVECRVTEAFNSSGTDQITVGYDADTDAIATTINVSTVGVKTVTLGAEGDYNSTERALEAYYTAGGSAPTTGKALITVRWTKVSAQP